MKGNQIDSDKLKRGSGKQILHAILADLSTKLTPEENLAEATDRLRAGLLLHGSTAHDTYEAASRLTWANSLNDEGEVIRQGIATSGGSVFISDLFESMMEVPQLKQEMLKIYPCLQSDEYEAGMLAIWLIVSSLQTFTSLLSVEIESSRIDVDSWVESMMKHYRHHFDHPEEW